MNRTKAAVFQGSPGEAWSKGEPWVDPRPWLDRPGSLATIALPVYFAIILTIAAYRNWGHIGDDVMRFFLLW